MDSSAVLALTNRADSDHERVVRGFDELKSTDYTLFTTNFLRSETYTLLGPRLGWDVARSWLDEFDLPLCRITRNDENEARDLLLSYDDKSYSFVNATSFVVMDRMGVGLAFTLDEDFRHHGYTIKPA